MDGAQRFTGTHRIPYLFLEYDPHRRIHSVFFLFPAAAQDHSRHAHIFAANRGNETIARRVDLTRVRGARQPSHVVDHPGITALQPDDLAKCITSAPGGNHFPGEGATVGQVGRTRAQDQHPRGKLDAQVDQVLRAAAMEDFDALFHFQCVADFSPQRLAHVGD